MNFTDIIYLFTAAKSRKNCFKCFVLRTYILPILDFCLYFWTNNSFAVILKNTSFPIL